jgi:hypothetical protein
LFFFEFAKDFVNHFEGLTFLPHCVASIYNFVGYQSLEEWTPKASILFTKTSNIISTLFYIFSALISLLNISLQQSLSSDFVYKNLCFIYYQFLTHFKWFLAISSKHISLFFADFRLSKGRCCPILVTKSSKNHPRVVVQDPFTSFPF